MVSFLRVYVGGGEGIDMAAKGATGCYRRYKVVTWVIPGQEFVTQLVEARLQNPAWNCHFDIFIAPEFDYPSLLSTHFLNVEVIREEWGGGDDPRTSKHSAVVGRARIPLPRMSQFEAAAPYKRHGLAAADGGEVRAGGHIYIRMEIGEYPDSD